ncbi:restriction endonuclease subunit S, partial [uncultured Brachyspira sp.]|uniref:restriction endonuclease subunit S n=1 Tax=uncultured Brachyspira sp. TaxID=221953 RepID=UPI00321FB4DB
MSKLEELLKKECPDGVEYVPLWSVTIWDKKFNSVDKDKQKTTIKYKYYLADELKELVVENGDVKILTTNISNLFTLEKLVSNSLSYGEIVCIPWGGNPIVQYYKGKFITSDNRIATSIDVNKLDNKFLYYVLINKLDLISSFYRGAGIKHPDMSRVLDIIIPLPPIEVQKEIVCILDTFTKYQYLLNRELELRKKQYEYYRGKLLTFGDEVKWKKLNDISEIKSGRNKIKNEVGKYPVYGSTGIIAYSDDYVFNEPHILIARVGINAGYVHIANGLYDVSDNTLIITELSPDICFKYMYYILVNIRLNNYIKGGGIPLITAGEIKNILIPIPPLEEQERIV